MPSVLITGASRGIGRSAAFAFAEAGWDLILLSRSEASLQSLATELASTGQRIVYGAVDLTKPEEIAPGVATLLSQGLTPSVLINNAGWELLNNMAPISHLPQTPCFLSGFCPLCCQSSRQTPRFGVFPHNPSGSLQSIQAFLEL